METIKKNIYVVIPLYNDGKVISSVITDLKDNGYENIIVVDDGSKDDGYKAVQQEKDIIYAHHIINRGQGAALQTGIEIALSKEAKYIATFDSDGQHQAKDLDHMISTLINNHLDIVLGSRFLQKNDIPLKKKIILKGGILFTFLLSHIWLTDVHNGLRIFTAETAKKLDLQHDRMEHASEILDKIKLLHLKYQEVPVTILYTEYSKAKGQSIINSISIAFKLILAKMKI